MSSPPDKSCSSLDTSSSPDESLNVVIEENYKHLVENLRVFELLTGAHSFKGIISDKLDSEIMAKEPDQKQAMAQKFINAFLDSNDQTKGRVLKTALGGRAHDLVRTILCKGLSDEVVAHFHNMQILDHSRKLLITKIECDEMLMSSCLSQNLITQEECEEVRAKISKSGPSRGLIHLLESVKKTLNGYRTLLKVLWDLNYKSVVKQVDRVEYYNLKAEHKSGGSDDADISRKSSNQDVEKGETKMLNALNIPPENNLSDDGPVSSRTRSQLASHKHASEDSSLHGLVQLTVIVPGLAMETKLGFSSPHLINATVMQQNARALSQTDYKKDSLNNIAASTTPKLIIVNDDDAGHQFKQGYARESSENREMSIDRICDSGDANFASEHRHSQDHQDVKDRYRSQSGQDVRHQANTVHGAQGNVSKKRDLHQTTNTRNCNSRELLKNSVSVESLASQSKSPSNRSESTTFHGDVTKDFSNKETTRTGQDRILQPRPDQQRQSYVSCVHCEKRFLTEQKLNSHVEKCDKKISQAGLKCRASTKHSRPAGEEKRASVKQSLSSSADMPRSSWELPRSSTEMPRSSGGKPRSLTEMPRSSGALPRSSTEMPRSSGGKPRSLTEMPRSSGTLPRSLTEMPRSSGGQPRSLTEMPRSSLNRPQPPVANPRPLVFRCIKCDQSFLEKKSLDKHERKGNCHL